MKTPPDYTTLLVHAIGWIFVIGILGHIAWILFYVFSK